MKIFQQKTVIVNGITYTAWDTLNVTDMNFMFGKHSINGGSPSIGNTSKVTNMSRYVLSSSFYQEYWNKGGYC
jgi:hypothetical protein